MSEGASKIIVEEEEPQLRQIDGVPTGELAVVGITERGPVGVSTVLNAWEDYVRIFGKDIANGKVSHVARGYFAEGGQTLHVVRTVHYSDIDDADSATSATATRQLSTGNTGPYAGTVLGENVGPFALTPGNTLILSVDGGGDQTATFTATAASRTSGAGTFALSNSNALTLSIDGGAVQSIPFLTAEFVSIGAATATEVAAVINAKLIGGRATVSTNTVVITSDRFGTGSGVNVTGGSANGVLGFTTGNQAGTGNVSDIRAVTVAEVKTIVEAVATGVTVANAGGAVRITSNTTGAGSSVQVTAPSTADDELGIDNAVHSGGTGSPQATIRAEGKYPGTYANLLAVRINAATNGVAAEFDLQVIDDGRVVKTFPNLSMDDEHPRYVETVVNDPTTGSPTLAIVDLAISGTATERRPANGTSPVLSGGNDGLSGLVELDFIGSSASKVGMYALDRAETAAQLSVSDMPTPAVHNAMTAYCELWRKMDMFPILDPPVGQSAAQIVTYVETTASLLESSEFGAIYWPNVKVLNPSRAVYGNVDYIVVPPSGIIAGVNARQDGKEGGVYQAAAGTELGVMRSVVGFETDEVLDERKRDLVYDKRINPLTTKRGQPKYIDGVLTLKSTGNFPTVGERRGMIYIEQSVKDGLEFARHRNNTPKLRARVHRAVYNFMVAQMRLEAFRSMDPDTAFFVDFGDALNTVAEQFAGRLIGRIGVATAKPAEWIILRFSQDTRAFDVAAAA